MLYVAVEDLCIDSYNKMKLCLEKLINISDVVNYQNAFICIVCIGTSQ